MRSLVQILSEYGRTLLLALLLSLGIRAAVVEAFWVPSGSMEPTLEVGDRILGEKLTHWFTDVHRGDIVVFAPPPLLDSQPTRFVKRVIALPGDEVAIRTGRVYVNGIPLQEPYIAAPPRYTLSPARVPEGTLFVLGDNRNDSFDSHAWGFLPLENVTAKVFLRYWPLDRLSTLP